MFKIIASKNIFFFIKFRNSPVKSHETLRFFITYTVLIIICLVPIFLLVCVNYRILNLDDYLKQNLLYYRSTGPVLGYRFNIPEELVTELTENVHTEDYYEKGKGVHQKILHSDSFAIDNMHETEHAKQNVYSEETTLLFHVDNEYDSGEQTEREVIYLDPIMFDNLFLDMQDVNHAFNEENDFRFLINYERDREDQGVGDYMKSKSKRNLMNVLLGRNTDLPNRLPEKQVESGRQGDGNDNVIIYDPKRNSNKFMNHYLDRNTDMKNTFLVKEIKKDIKNPASVHDPRRYNSKIMNTLFDTNVNNMPQAFQNKQFNLLKAMFLNNGEQKSNMSGIMVNYYDKNEETDKDENIIDKKRNFILKSEENEDEE